MLLDTNGALLADDKGHSRPLCFLTCLFHSTLQLGAWLLPQDSCFCSLSLKCPSFQRNLTPRSPENGHTLRVPHSVVTPSSSIFLPGMSSCHLTPFLISCLCPAEAGPWCLTSGSIPPASSSKQCIPYVLNRRRFD